MKKVLLGTSAAALVAVAGPAMAAEWEITIGGYAEMELGFASTDINARRGGVEDLVGTEDFTTTTDEGTVFDEAGFDAAVDAAIDGLFGDEPDVDGVDLHRDIEIHFTAKIVLDNGLEFGAQAEIEAEPDGSSEHIDESEVFISGAFGEIVLGNEDAAGERMAFVAPDVGIIAANSGTMSQFIQYDLTPGYSGSAFLTTSLNETFVNDDTGITYFTPRLAGVQLGVSYFRDDNQDDGLDTDLNTESIAHIVSFGANYVQSFGGVDVAVSGFYSFAQSQVDGVEDPEIYGFGANFGFGGFTLGGSWGQGNDLAVLGIAPDGSVSTGALIGGDGNGWDVGVSYETGPWAVSATFFRGKVDTFLVTDTGFDSEGNEFVEVFGYEEELNLINVSGTYALAQGVTLVAEGGYADYENAIADADGFFIGTGVDLSF
ncbi:MAG: porin [Pseudomonadota bacterium]